MWFKTIFLIVVTFTLADVGCEARNRVVCYFGSWANYRDGDGKFVVEDIDPFLCTHAIYSFAKLENNQIAAYDPWLDLRDNWGLGGYERFNNLKRTNPQLTTLLAIGGWNEGSTKYSQMASSPQTRGIFVRSVVDFLRRHGFNGLDMDWEYPANRGGDPRDKQTFPLLLKELKEAFRPHGLILSAAVAAGKSIIDSAYDIPEISKHLDFINLMAYDYHGSWENTAGHNAPAYARPDEPENQKTLNVDFSVRHWLGNGAPPEKLVLGMGTYGRSFTLARASENGIGAPTTGAGEPGPFTREGGILGYNEICRFLREGWTERWARHIEAPYAFRDRQWVGYDNVWSVEVKTNYLKQHRLGGGMIWSLETDDFRGNCGGRKYPLLSRIWEMLNG